MRVFLAVVERCRDTGMYIGYIPGFPGANTQATTLDELRENLHEVVELLLEDGDPVFETEFIGLQTVVIT